MMELNSLNVGIKGNASIIVTADDTAAKYGSGLIDVYATPAMIGLMEKTAQLSIQTLLPEGAITLGIEVNVKHLKATLIGKKVRCETELIAIDGKKLLFNVNAWDEVDLIGSGNHVRFIVDAKKFMERL